MQSYAKIPLKWPPRAQGALHGEIFAEEFGSLCQEKNEFEPLMCPKSDTHCPHARNPTHFKCANGVPTRLPTPTQNPCRVSPDTHPPMTKSGRVDNPGRHGSHDPRSIFVPVCQCRLPLLLHYISSRLSRAQHHHYYYYSIHLPEPPAVLSTGSSIWPQPPQCRSSKRCRWCSFICRECPS